MYGDGRGGPPRSDYDRAAPHEGVVADSSTLLIAFVIIALIHIGEFVSSIRDSVDPEETSIKKPDNW